MAKPFDVSKFRKEITKSIDGLSIGFNDPTDWISTGNYALNYLISGDFNRGIPLGKVTVFAGESGAGKSYICSGNIIKNAQEQGIFVVLIDSENALDEDWLKALGVDTSEYALNLVPGFLPVIPYTSTVDGINMPFEAVTSTIAGKTYIYEPSPQPNTTFNVMFPLALDNEMLLT